MSHFVAFDIVRGSSEEDKLPRKIELRPSPRATFFLFAMLIPALIAAALVPYLMSAYLAASAQNFSRYILDNSLAATELLLASLVLAALFFYLLIEFLIRIGRKRTVWLSRTSVTIVERSPFGVRDCWIPVSDYQGIAHYVRSTVSDQHHELVLVHRDAGSSILLHVGTEKPGQLMNQYCTEFGLPEIDARNVRNRDMVSLLPVSFGGKLQNA